MARDIRVYDITVPVGGSASAPLITNLPMPARIVTAVEFMIPNGNRGAVKFALAAAGTRIIPSNPSAYITGDAETIHWDLHGYHDSGSWDFHAYNNGGFAHIIEVRFLLDLPQDRLSAPLQPLAVGLLNG